MSSKAPAPGDPRGEAPENDQDAFAHVYKQNVRWVWHMLRRLSVAEKDVMDVAQNVFLVVHRRLPEFEGRSSVRTWLGEITRRVASDYRRSAPVRREVHTETAELDFRPATTSNSEENASRAEKVALARAILEKLPDAQRTVFIMFELEQMSGAEIAEELGVPVGTVRSRLRLAREAFQSEVAVLQRAAPKRGGG